jgi:hypothetical protein
VTPAVRLRQSETDQITSEVSFFKVFAYPAKATHRVYPAKATHRVYSAKATHRVYPAKATHRVYHFLLRLAISDPHLTQVFHGSSDHLQPTLFPLQWKWWVTCESYSSDHVQILWSVVCQTVVRGTPMGFREKISMIAKHFPVRTHRQLGSFYHTQFVSYSHAPDNEMRAAIAQLV